MFEGFERVRVEREGATIEDAVRRRSARVWAPRYVGVALAARGLLQPFSEWRAMRDPALMASILSPDEAPPHQ